MKIEVLSSGSKGNTTYIECGNTKIIIDMGNTCKYVCDKLKGIGVDAKDIDAILITHTHVDHIKGLKVFSKKYNPTVYITEPMIEELDFLTEPNIITNDIFQIENIKIEVVKTSHDAKGSVGYIINYEEKSIVYITDTGYINKKYFTILKNRDIYIMESNHDIEMLNNGKYPFKLRQRILSDKGHLSNYDSARYLSNFIGTKTKYIILAHLSEENNTEDLAYNALTERLTQTNQKVSNIIIAKQNKETELINI